MSSDDGKKAMTPQARIGFIGLGLMGGGMAMNILKKHGQLNVCDLDERALAPLLEAGALRMDSPRALGEASDIVLTSLPDPAISKRVVLGAEGLIEGLAAGSTVIGMSTDGIETVREIQAALAARQIRFVDCPVGKGPTAAVAGELQLFAGGGRLGEPVACLFCVAVGATVGLGHHQGHGAFEHFRVAPENVEGLVENFELLAFSEEQAGECPVEIVASGDARGFEGAQGVDHAVRPDRDARRAQHAREVHDVVAEVARAHWKYFPSGLFTPSGFMASKRVSTPLLLRCNSNSTAPGSYSRTPDAFSIRPSAKRSKCTFITLPCRVVVQFIFWSDWKPWIKSRQRPPSRRKSYSTRMTLPPAVRPAELA